MGSDVLDAVLEGHSLALGQALIRAIAEKGRICKEVGPRRAWHNHVVARERNGPTPGNVDGGVDIAPAGV